MVTKSRHCLLMLCLALASLSTYEEARALCKSGTTSYYGAGEKLRKKTADGSSAKKLGKVMTAASWDFPLGSYVQVTYGIKTILVKITDRGPAKRLKKKDNRILDLSYGAAKALGKGFIDKGVAPIRVCSNNGGCRMAKDPDFNYDAAPASSPTQTAWADTEQAPG